MEQQLLALTQQFSIELTPDQIEKVKGHQTQQSSPSPTLFHSPTPDVIAPPQPPVQGVGIYYIWVGIMRFFEDISFSRNNSNGT